MCIINQYIHIHIYIYVHILLSCYIIMHISLSLHIYIYIYIDTYKTDIQVNVYNKSSMFDQSQDAIQTGCFRDPLLEILQV